MMLPGGCYPVGVPFNWSDTRLNGPSPVGLFPGGCPPGESSRVVDLAGNVDATPARAQVVVDGVVPDVEIDFPTARRLFTLICVLHFRG